MNVSPLRWLYIAFALLFIGAGGYAVWSYRHMAEQAAQLAPLQQQVAGLQTSYATLAKAVAARDAAAANIRQRSAATTKRLDDATKADPPAARYLSERIPDGVRRAYQHQTNPTR